MSATDIIRNAVEVAFAAAGDFVQTVTWQKQTFGDYDPVAGARAITIASLPVRAVEEEIGTAESSRLKLSQHAVHLLVPQVDFEKAGAGDPAFADKLVHRGITYTARDVQFRGVKAVWEIYADV